MKIVTTKDLVTTKNGLAAQLLREPDERNRNILAKNLADLEQEIGDRLYTDGLILQASINYISQASYLVSAGRKEEALEVYRNIKLRGVSPDTLSWINKEILRIQNS